MTTLIIATHNAHKVQEIQSILGAKFRCLSLDEFDDAPTPMEDGEYFGDNARIKAQAIAGYLAENHSNRFSDPQTYILADDSGLEVDALNGAPGVHSARFAALDTGAASNSSDTDNNAKLLRLLDGVPAEQRKARFKCSLVLMSLLHIGTDHKTFFAEGTCEGRITTTGAGEGGFGYDPLFVPDGHDRSFAELGKDIKNSLSHRARAVEKIRTFFPDS
ncbi:MAG: non-canonical purine NTP pyrophosphatase [Limisphaerales bacterium]